MNGDVLPDTFCRGVGQRFASLIVPVSLTMLATVWSVNNLTPLYVFGDVTPLALVYDESEQQSTSAKIGASVVNALAVITVVVLVTFCVLLLYKCGCTIVLFAWLILSACSIFFVMAWVWLDLFLTRFQIPYDTLSMSLFLWNLGVVGTVALFYYAHPVVNQGFLVFASILMAWVLTALPEWTTWTVLLAIAVYDIVAVLAPSGPLKLLIQAADERNEPIPGFVYDSSSAIAPTSIVGTAPASAVPFRPGPSTGQEQVRGRLSLVQLLKASMPFKLGLGDFIFYSLLVGKASTSGFLPWVFCCVAILAGMVGTFVSLFAFKEIVHALPALPISIFAATAVYFTCGCAVSPLADFTFTNVLVL